MLHLIPRKRKIKETGSYPSNLCWHHFRLKGDANLCRQIESISLKQHTPGMALASSLSSWACPLDWAAGVAMWCDTWEKSQIYSFSQVTVGHYLNFPGDLTETLLALTPTPNHPINSSFEDYNHQCIATYFHVVPVTQNLSGGPPRVAACLRHVVTRHLWWTLMVEQPESQTNVKCCIFLWIDPKKKKRHEGRQEIQWHL